MKQNRGKNEAMKREKTLSRATKQEVTNEAAEGAATVSSWVRAPSAGVALQNPRPPGATPGAQTTTVQEGGGTEAKRGGTEGQVHVEEVGLDRGAGTDSKALEDLGHGAVAGSGTSEDLGRGTMVDRETLEGLGHGAVADNGTLEDLGHGTVAGSGTLEQKSTMLDSEEPGAMAGQGEQAAMARQAEQAEQGAIGGQTGAVISTMELVTSIAERCVHGQFPWPWHDRQRVHY
ncbi:hypothetical protein M9458_054413 [Cirrhinus mrigala]|uniref:Uncharacterized protein n=1 Tax=Cirrhinus mrigala TaxID=683832 RepID=A0ABD0MJH0_CIRMR